MFLAAALAVGLVSCGGAAGPQTVTGVVVDASMNNIMVRTDAGDTVDISTMDTDPAKVPGVLIDDSVRVVCAGKDVDGVKVLTAQELTVTVHSPYYYIQGTWLDPSDQSLGVRALRSEAERFGRIGWYGYVAFQKLEPCRRK